METVSDALLTVYFYVNYVVYYFYCSAIANAVFSQYDYSTMVSLCTSSA
jgi:hypothetical protein